PGASTCLVLVTSRNRLTGLVAADGAYPVTLDLVTEAEARQLLARRIGPDRVAAEPEAVRGLITACAPPPPAPAPRAARPPPRPAPAVGPPRRPATRCRRAAGRVEHRRPAHRRAGGVLLVLPGPHPAGRAAVSAAGPAPRPGYLRRRGGQPRRPAPRS